MRKLNICYLHRLGLLAFFMFISVVVVEGFLFSNMCYATVGVSHSDLRDLKAEISDKIFTMNEMVNSLNESENDRENDGENDIDNNDGNNYKNIEMANKSYTAFGAVCFNKSSNSLKNQEMFFFNSFWIRFTAEVNLKVAIVSLKVAPFFGFIWGRANPNQWKNY